MSKSRSSSSSDVPAFLRGDNGPTYRATGGGGGGGDFEHSAPSMFAMGSRSPSTSFAPAPLKFPSGASEDHFARMSQPAAAYPGWGLDSSSPLSSKAKRFESGLGERVSVAAPLNVSEPDLVAAGMSRMSLNHLARPRVSIDSDSDEAAEHPFAVKWTPPFAAVRVTATSDDTADVLQHLSHALARFVDFELDLKARKIRGVTYDKCDRCQFTLQLVRRPQEGAGSHTVEFQRASGPARLFASFVASTTLALGSIDFFSAVERVQSGRDVPGLSGGDAAVPDVPVGGAGVSLDQGACEELVDMCASAFEDVRLEAFRTLLPLMSGTSGTSNTRDIHKFVGPRLIPVMTQAYHVGGTSHGRGEDLAWCLAYLAAHMCVVPDFAARSAALVPLLFTMLAAAPSVAGRGTQRQAARALLLISRADPVGVVATRGMDQYLSVLGTLVGSCDPELQSCVKGVLDALSAGFTA